MCCIGQLSPRIRNRVVGFGKIRFSLHGRIGNRVKEFCNPSIGDEFTTERYQLKGMPCVVHIGHFCPRIIHRVVSHEPVCGITAVLEGNAPGDIDHSVLGRNTGKTNRFRCWHRSSIRPISIAGVVNLNDTGGLYTWSFIGMMVTNGVDFIVDNSTFVVLLFFFEFLDSGRPLLVGNIKNFDRFCR